VYRPILVAVLVLPLSPALSGERMTVAQFREMLTAQKAAHKSDKDAAAKIAGVELTEQLTAATLDQIRAEMSPGPKTAEALELQSDISGFLDPPPGERPTRDAPDDATRQRMLRQAIEFAAITLHRMPDFLATRATRGFDDSPQIMSNAGWYPAQRDLHSVGSYTEPITYRDGKEVFDVQPGQPGTQAGAPSSPSGLTSSGEFGPVLANVITDALKGKMTWDYWQQTPAGLAAVFQFEIPKEASHYSVSFCWIVAPTMASYRHVNDLADAQTNCYRGTPGYHGSLSIDPATGTILRIAIESDLPASDRLAHADLFVEYGPVEIGGRTYICPVRSVAISLIRFPDASPARTMLCLNDAAFTGYHRFGASVRILSAH
jgi:hypothetical protein